MVVYAFGSSTVVPQGFEGLRWRGARRRQPLALRSLRTLRLSMEIKKTIKRSDISVRPSARSRSLAQAVASGKGIACRHWGKARRVRV
jgi:hypothetical protein